jgi:hypothetical protein
MEAMMKCLTLFELSVCVICCHTAFGQIQFTDYTQISGLDGYPELGFGTAIVDYNNDNLLDIFVVGQNGHNRLFKNLGTFEFSDQTQETNVSGSGAGWGVCYGDFDTDGDEDIYISRRDYIKNDLFVFDETTFDEAAEQWAVGDQQGFGYAACFAPLTKNQALDILTANQAWPDYRRQSCHFFANNLIGPFIDFSVPSHIADSSQYWDCISTADYDNDGDLDLLVSSEPRNRLYRNDGWGILTNVSDSSGINLPLDGDTTGYGIAWGDYNNDGWMDVYISFWHSQHGELFRNNGNSTFTDVTQQLGLGLETWSHSVAFGDFDNDGWLDLYAVTGGSGNKLYANNNGNNFAEISQEAGVTDGHWCCGLSTGDFDYDGKLDMVIGHYADGGDNPNKIALYRNITNNSNNWIGIKVNGYYPNLDAIGARVRIVAGGLSQVREVSGGSGFGSQNMLPLHFGIGNALMVDSLIISYPNSQLPDIIYPDMAPGFYYNLPELTPDVECVNIFSADTLFDCEAPLEYSVEIANVGNVAIAAFKVLCWVINDELVTRIDSTIIPYLELHDTTVYNFRPNYMPGCRENYLLFAATKLIDDVNASNDTAYVGIYAGYLYDLASEDIFSPNPDSLTIPIIPSFLIRNVGILSQGEFSTLCEISYDDSSVYESYRVAQHPIDVGHDEVINFSEFYPNASGRYDFRFNVALSSDSDRSNDTSFVSVYVGGICHYVLGDINNNGVVNGMDILYGVRCFKGEAPPTYLCNCVPYGDLFIAGDVNGTCSFNGQDITCMVDYFKGGENLRPCVICPPIPAATREDYRSSN